MLDTSPGRILLVEDEEVVRHVTSLLLQGKGYAVNTARDGREALDLLHGQPPPDLILLELRITEDRIHSSARMRSMK
jgi:CheY-like chemotaxis protein